MNAEELVIGHYEKTLTSEQESHLASLVETSPDVRTLYEQHGNIHGLMVEDAETVETSSKLDKVVVGAALGTLVEIAGHGIGISIFGKVASVIGAIAVGGGALLLYNSFLDEDVPLKPATPVTRQAPASGVPNDPASARSETPTVSATPVETPADEPARSSDVNVPGSDAASRPSASDARSPRGAQEGSKSRDAASSSGTGVATPNMQLGGEDPATIPHRPRVDPERDAANAQKPETTQSTDTSGN